MEIYDKENLFQLLDTIKKLVYDKNPSLTPEQLCLALYSGGFAFVSALLEGTHRDQATQYALNVSKSIPKIISIINTNGKKLTKDKKLDMGVDLFKRVAIHNLPGVSDVQRFNLCNALGNFLNIYTHLFQQKTPKMVGSGIFDNDYVINWLSPSSDETKITGSGEGDYDVDFSNSTNSTSFWGSLKNSVFDKLNSTGVGNSSYIPLSDPYNTTAVPTTDTDANGMKMLRYAGMFGIPTAVISGALGLSPIPTALLAGGLKTLGLVADGVGNYFMHNYYYPALDNPSKHPWLAKIQKWTEPVRHTWERMNNDPAQRMKILQIQNEIQNGIPAAMRDIYQQEAALQTYNNQIKQYREAERKAKLAQKLTWDNMDLQVDEDNKVIRAKNAESIRKNAEERNAAEEYNRKVEEDYAKKEQDRTNTINSQYEQAVAQKEKEWNELSGKMTKSINDDINELAGTRNFNFITNSKRNVQLGTDIHGEMGIPRIAKVGVDVDVKWGNQYEARLWQDEEEETLKKIKDLDPRSEYEYMNRFKKYLDQPLEQLPTGERVLKLVAGKVGNVIFPVIFRYSSLEEAKTFADIYEQFGTSPEEFNKLHPHSQIAPGAYYKIKQAIFMPGLRQDTQQKAFQLLNKLDLREDMANISNKDYLRNKPEYFETPEFQELNRQIEHDVGATFSPKILTPYVPQVTMAAKQHVPEKLKVEQLLPTKEHVKRNENVFTFTSPYPQIPAAAFATPVYDAFKRGQEQQMASFMNNLAMNGYKTRDELLIPPVDTSGVEKVQPGPTSDYKNGKSSLRFNNVHIYTEPSRIVRNRINPKYLRKSLFPSQHPLMTVPLHSTEQINIPLVPRQSVISTKQTQRKRHFKK